MKKKLFLLMLLAALLALFVSGCGNNDAVQEEDGTVTDSEDAVSDDGEKTDYDAYMAALEEDALAIEDFLANEALTQADMNEKSQELYALWDGALNYLWGELKAVLPEEEFAALLDEQLAWIEEKESAMEEAGKEVEGGSLYPLVVNSEGARLTKDRVYELYALVK